MAASSALLVLAAISPRSLVWLVAQIHLLFAPFVLGAPIFIVVCEWLGHRRRDQRYERLARETMKVVAIAYSFTALSGAAFAFVLMGSYQEVATHLLDRMGPVFAAYVGRASIWSLVNNDTFSGLNLHRFIANITFGGFMVALFAAFMFLMAKSREDRAFYDWMGFIGNFIGVATLILLPLAGYIYAKEIFLYDANIATFQMADKLSSFFVMQGLLVSLLFLGVNYYMWMSIRRIDGA